MSDKFCCVTYKDLGAELAEAKSIELHTLMEDKGLPKSMFSSVFRVLEGILNYCPVCGANINASGPVPDRQLHADAIKQIKTGMSEPASYVLETRKCAACAGRGTLGIDKNNVSINCMKCHGAGTFSAKHIAVDPKSKIAQDKVDLIRETSGIGDKSVNIDEKGIE